MQTRPSDEELAAAVGQPGGKLKKLRGGPFFYQFEVAGAAREVLVLDGKVAQKGLDSVARYLSAVRMLDHKTMQLDELCNLLGTYGELPDGFDAFAARNLRGPHEPTLRYGEHEATLVLYAHEPPPKPAATPPGPPRPPRPIGAAPPRFLRATLHIKSDYQLGWLVEAQLPNTNDQWVERWTPAPSEVAAALGVPVDKVGALTGGPIFYSVVADGRSRKVFALDHKVYPPGLEFVGRYLHNNALLERKNMEWSQLAALLGNCDALPAGFGAAALGRGPNDALPALTYDQHGARLVLYAQADGHWLRATLVIPTDYKLSWKLDRL